jgi:hypothetical protein
LFVLALSGCARCNDDGPAVPFKIGAAADASKAKPEPDKATTANAAEGSAYPGPVDRPLIDGRALPITRVIATLAVDLDADGDRDVIAAGLRENEANLASLFVLTREQDAFEPARLVTQLVEAPNCRAEEPTLAALSATKAALSYFEACAEPSSRSQRLALLSLEATPRLLERFSGLADAEGRSITLAAHSKDVDDDGHDDVALDVTLSAPDLSAPITMSLPWLDRASGIARDVREPDSSLAARAAAAQGLLRKTPDQAAEQAKTVLALHAALCDGPHPPLLQIGTTAGIACKADAALANAAATIASAQAALGNIENAADAWLRLERMSVAASGKAREFALKALAAMKPRPDIALAPGPEIVPSTSKGVLLPNARFVTDSLLYLRRPEPAVYDVNHQTETVAPPQDDRIRDPQGTLFVLGLKRTCGGILFQAARSDAPSEGPLPPQAIKSALLVKAAADPSCREAALSDEVRDYKVLGWAPQGVLAARGSEVRILPLTVDGTPLGESRVLAHDAPRPAPISPGIATPDASRYAYALPFGVVVYGQQSSELWRPTGYAELFPSITDIAISPSGRRVAIVAKRRVYVLSAAANTAGATVSKPP